MMRFFLVHKAGVLVGEVEREFDGKRKKLLKYRNIPMMNIMSSFMIEIITNTRCLSKPLNAKIYYTGHMQNASLLKTAMGFGVGHYNFNDVTVMSATDEIAKQIGENGILVTVESADKPL